MAERRWSMQRGSVGVWQRLPHGPCEAERAGAGAAGAAGGAAADCGGLVATTLLAVVAAGWAHV